jgi:hypothetical protein
VDTLVGLLLAKTVMAGTSLGVFDVLQEGALTVGEISTRCESDTPAMERLLRALLACGYLKSNKNRYELSAVSRRWLLSNARCSLRSAIIHRGLDLRVMRFEEYVREGTIHDFHGTLKGEDWKIYHEGQASHASLIADEVVERAPLPRGAADLLDLGGGHGLFPLRFVNGIRDYGPEFSIWKRQQEAHRHPGCKALRAIVWSFESLIFALHSFLPYLSMQC